MAACAFIWSAEVHAQPVSSSDYSDVIELLANQEWRLTAQENQIQEQQRLLADQRALIERQRQQIEALRNGVDSTGTIDPPQFEGLGAEGAPTQRLSDTERSPEEPLFANRRAPIRTRMPLDGGSAPPEATPAAAPRGPLKETQISTVEAFPEGQNPLLGRGQLEFEPSFEFLRTSGNHLGFRGVAIIGDDQIGLIQVTDADRDTIVSSVALRYGVSDRLEVEARVPYIDRDDRLTTTAQTFDLNGSDVGDVEFVARYLLNENEAGRPVFVAGARVKSTTGVGPFDVARDSQGFATELATGSGFWAAQGSISVHHSAEPGVFFAHASYTHRFSDAVDQTYGVVTIGEVDPGDAIGIGAGFGLSIGQRVSASVGYSQDYVMASEIELNGVEQETDALHAGALQFGVSYRASERLALSAGLDVGVTDDAPDFNISIRAPFRW